MADIVFNETGLDKLLIEQGDFSLLVRWASVGSADNIPLDARVQGNSS